MKLPRADHGVRADQHRRSVRRPPRHPRRRARPLQAPILRARIRGCRAEHALGPGQPLGDPRPGVDPRPAFPAPAARRGQAGELSGRPRVRRRRRPPERVRNLPPMGGGRDRRNRQLLSPGGVRARLPGADRRGPPDLSAQRRLCPRRGRRSAVRRPGDRHRLAAAARDRVRPRPVVRPDYPGFRRPCPVKCRHCANDGFIPFADLGSAPPSNAMRAAPDSPETEYPLVVAVCDRCFLAQVDDHPRAEEIFGSDYSYFSSYSKSWLAHAERFAALATGRFGLGPGSQVLEIASNDGYLLQYFRALGIPVLGVEPTANTAEVAIGKGIPTIVDFFGQGLAEQRLAGSADLIVGNNVFAHVPDINDFSAGLKTALKPDGVISLEFPHLLRLIEQVQFDTIYHENFSYLSLGTGERILGSRGLRVFDVAQLSTHGGSLRVFAAHAEDESRPRSPNVDAILAEEEGAGLRGRAIYESFQPRIDAVRSAFRTF